MRIERDSVDGGIREGGTCTTRKETNATRAAVILRVLLTISIDQWKSKPGLGFFSLGNDLWYVCRFERFYLPDNWLYL
tara:strand:+ start:1368 stop:1601 length:234 start_codon:yes stop_codon:yes gene_type:complete